MSMPSGIAAIDGMLDLGSGTPAKRVVEQMDKAGVERALVDVDPGDAAALAALREFPGRFLASCALDPNRGMDEVGRLVALYERFGLVAASAFPSGCRPPVPIDDKRFYPLYATCIELDIAVCVRAGVPREPVPMAAQHVERIDEVCAYFPELRFVIRHGGEPWTALAVLLMRKWPNLYYATSALAPRSYPEDVVRYANAGGAERVLYATGCALDLERSFAELPHVPFQSEVWPKFLRENAIRVFKLD